MASDEYRKLKKSITDNQSQVQNYMKELQNPPAEYTNAYSALKDLFGAYNEMVNCAISPNGNLNSYSSTFNSADTSFSNKYDAVKLYM